MRFENALLLEPERGEGCPFFSPEKAPHFFVCFSVFEVFVTVIVRDVHDSGGAGTP